MNSYQQRHNGMVLRYEERANQYAVLIVQIVSTYNGGSILALLSFIAARKEKEFLEMGVWAIVVFGMALLLVIASAAAGYFFQVEAHRVLANAEFDEDGTLADDPAVLESDIKATNKIRMTGVGLMIMAVLFSVIGSLFGACYLLGGLLFKP